MNLFVLVALLCTGGENNADSCDYHALDSNLSSTQCDSYFTDSGLNSVDSLITDIASYDQKEYTLESLTCTQEETE